jgi:hypothetical protein
MLLSNVVERAEAGLQHGSEESPSS